MLTFAPALRDKRYAETSSAQEKEEYVHRHIGLTAVLTEMLEQQKESKRIGKI